jgi:hypothetical protein
MRTVMTAALLLSLAATPVLGPTPAFAQDSAKVILDRHERTIKAGDLNGVMADYADNAVLVTPAGIVAGEKNIGGVNLFDGKANIRKFFVVLTTRELPAVKTMATSYEYKTNDTVLMHWRQYPGTPKEVSGTDIWVIRGGKIITQVVLVNPPKK